MRMMKQKIGTLIRKTLNRPGGQLILGKIASIYSLYSRGGYTPVYTKDGLWIHKTSDGYIIDRYVNFSATISDYKLKAEASWCYTYKPRSGDIIIDVGAGIGTEAAFFSPEIGSTGVLVSVEANPVTFHALNLFCELNGFANVKRVHAAIHDNEEPVYIENSTSHVSNSIINSNQGGGVMVTGMTVDQLVKRYDLTRVDFIKMNIEGAEQYALGGMKETLNKTKYICISCHDFKADCKGVDWFRTKVLVKTFLEEQGFVIVERKGDSRPWVKDQVNAYNPCLVDG
jgi:FkbM family methyltransferase